MKSIENYDVIVVGAGLSGITIAECFARVLKKNVLILEKRDHIGGNCFDEMDPITGIRVSRYGAHLFHTNNERVLHFIKRYGEWISWEHKVLALVDGSLVPMPPNIQTVNALCGADITSQKEMQCWLKKHQIPCDFPSNGKEMALSRVGKELYNKLFKHYTFKQWNQYPEDLDPEILARIPIRDNFDDRYFTDTYQLLPRKGYTEFFETILRKNSRISLKMDSDFFQYKHLINKQQVIIYTGPIDLYYAQLGLGKLEYRSIEFTVKRRMNCLKYQENSVINYPSPKTPYTRCVEYKHFLKQKSPHTIYVKEKTTSYGDPYYPVLNNKNLTRYKKYQEMAQKETNIHFLGRLASYKYFNMDQAIEAALDYFDQHFNPSFIGGKSVAHAF